MALKCGHLLLKMYVLSWNFITNTTFKLIYCNETYLNRWKAVTGTQYLTLDSVFIPGIYCEFIYKTQYAHKATLTHTLHIHAHARTHMRARHTQRTILQYSRASVRTCCWPRPRTCGWRGAVRWRHRRRPRWTPPSPAAGSSSGPPSSDFLSRPRNVLNFSSCKYIEKHTLKGCKIGTIDTCVESLQLKTHGKLHVKKGCEIGTDKHVER